MKRHYSKQADGSIRCTLCRQPFPSAHEFGSHCQPRNGKQGRGVALCKAQQGI